MFRLFFSGITKAPDPPDHSVSIFAGSVLVRGIAGADTDTYVTPAMPGILPGAVTALMVARTPLL